MTWLMDLQVLNNHILSVLIFLPLAMALLVLAIRNDEVVRWITLATMVVVFILTIPLICGFDTTTHTMQYVEGPYTWISAFNAQYYLGLDGISVLFVFLTGLIGIVSVLASWTSVKKSVSGFMACLLFMQTFMIGVFCSLDFFLFYIFWEAMLIPMYLLIGVWGGPRRIYAAVKFFLYTLVGSVLMLVGIIALYFAAGSTFDIQALMANEYSFAFQAVVFLSFFIAFAIKVPMFPFHTWLPDAHVEAPTAGSIILAGVLLKMGTYGFLRFSIPMFPDAANYFAVPIIILSIIGIIYGALLALAQTDLKKLIAYSSVSHMGFITFALFLFNVNGMEGGIIQMFNHGITTGALFLCVGIIYERTHTRELSEYGWVAKLMPLYAVFLFVFTLASLGFPGTNGFIGEILILFAAYEGWEFYLIFLLIGIILGTAYMLYLYKKLCFGAGCASHHGEEPAPMPKTAKTAKDINGREALALFILLIFVFWIGFQPMGYLDIMHESVAHLLDQAGHLPATEVLVEGAGEALGIVGQGGDILLDGLSDAVDSTAPEL
ncbi:MAG: NADH-quinone oxidoreductase subunit M [Deltaproteobacteria bacterium]|nr:NADH-quinone oxidoreductase subunit M [Deltaproteobacteria bacterium]